MRITAAARRLGISADWLRDLERAGRVPRARRDVSGHRRYSEGDIRRLRRLLFRARLKPSLAP